ncbi:hypothetical protein [Halomicrobium katesii]|uniref:hypothetical protein n=1 Tax=Halomicrobium katesii TaxID=437163 RepID=UPI00036731D7|nr:hypothetical protein [Halomicrobium katesii]
MLESATAFFVGALWAVVLAGYDTARDGIPDGSLVAGTDLSLRSAVDVCFVGGGSGAVLWLTHYRLGALAFGAAGYLLLIGVLIVTLYRPSDGFLER